MTLPPDEAGPPRRPRAGGRWQRWLTLAVSVIALGGTIWMVGARSLLDRLRGLEPGWLTVALLITAVQFALMAARWCFFAARVGVPLGYRRALGEYYLSVLLNTVLPVGVVGDVLRAFRHADHAGPITEKRPVASAVLAIVLERASGQVALVLVALAGAPVWWQLVATAAAGSKVPLGLPLAVAAVIVAGALLWWLAGRRGDRLRQIVTAGGRMFFTPHNLLLHLGLSFVLLASHVALFIVSAWAIGLDFPLIDALRIVPPVLLAATFLALFGGFGTREAAAAALFHLSGGVAADGALVAFVYGAVSALGSLPGLLALPWGANRRVPAQPGPEAQPPQGQQGDHVAGDR